MSYTLPIFSFASGFFLSITYITVFYHRGLTHRSVRLSPGTRRFVIATGHWVTGMDPKAWCCMHRLHHRHADEADDPHSLVNSSVPGVMLAQLLSYRRIMSALKKDEHAYDTVSEDLDFRVNWLNRHNLGLIPFFLHVGIAFALGTAFKSRFTGIAYWIGMMSHPVQGWMVNAFGHRYGYRNYETSDNSRNNTLVAWLVMGEGYQNNHHWLPYDAKFSKRWWEMDMGYGLCQLLEAANILEIAREPS